MSSSTWPPGFEALRCLKAPLTSITAPKRKIPASFQWAGTLPLQPHDTPTSRELAEVTSSKSAPNQAMLGMLIPLNSINEPQTVRARQDPPPCHRLKPLLQLRNSLLLDHTLLLQSYLCCQGTSEGLGRSSGWRGSDLRTCQIVQRCT